MHAPKSVAILLDSCLADLHAKQRESIKLAVNATLAGGDLSLSRLSQSLPCKTALRHRIKRMDRLLGNLKVLRARHRLYGAVARHWLDGIDRPLLVVDWSRNRRQTPIFPFAAAREAHEHVVSVGRESEVEVLVERRQVFAVT